VAVVLVDTSIWLDIVRGRLDLESVMSERDIAICPPIAQELLQGALDAESHEIAWRIIFAARMLDDPMPLDRFEEAAHIYRRCAWKGHAIASAFDCLIAACAIHNGVTLLQRDQDFEWIAEIAPLKLLPNT
jgi:predicted nucleic acid-binding protein